jgi:2-polyprenyl-3-methyl-5-hydroxy-6-metoxy-1,4-benzoquinol methylase
MGKYVHQCIPTDVKKYMKKEKKVFDYDTGFMGVFKDRSEGFYKNTYKEKPELRRIVDMVKVKQGKMLDIGSGGGLLTECLPFYFPKLHVFGCDISTTAIRYAKQFGTGKVEYKVMKKKLPYPSNYFNACICTDVIEHIPDVPYFLQEVQRILKKDGTFFLSIPCEGQPFTVHWLLRKIGVWADVTRKHIGHIHPEFTHEYVVNMFQKHGFTVISKKFNERLAVQLLRYIFFHIPKEMLELFIGTKKAESYYDRKIVVQNDIGTKDYIMGIRKLWFRLSSLTKFIYTIDAEYFTHIPFTAGKIFLLVRNDK